MRILGGREDIAMSQIIDAEGARVPAYEDAEKAFRVAFVLLTEPGQKAADVVDIAQTLNIVRGVWEQKFSEFTGGHVHGVHAEIDAACGSPTAKPVATTFAEAPGGNGNGVVEPGEPVTISVTLENDGPADATDVTVIVSADRIPVDGQGARLDRLAAGSTTTLRFTGHVPADAPCGQPLVRDTAVSGINTFRALASLAPGLRNAYAARFDDSGARFAVNLDGTDTATQNPWAWGHPISYTGNAGYVFQPDAASDGSPNAWFTGLERGHRLLQDSSLGVGTSTLWSPPIALAGTFHPTLQYDVWFPAIDFSNPKQGGITTSDIFLNVDGSVDGGKTWVQLDQLSGAVPAWQLRQVPLDGVVPLTGSMLVRFTVVNPAADQLVEAGLDALNVISQSSACNPNASTGGGSSAQPTAPPSAGCAVGGHAAAPLPIFALVLFASVLARRRRA